MPYRRRIEFPGAVYHVTYRGNNRQPIFLDSGDRWQFLQLLIDASRRRSVRVISLTLMDNHYHLLLETKNDPLSRFMYDINRRYTCYFNKKYARCGSLFQKPYWVKIIEDDFYFTAAREYIRMNPVNAGLVGEPSDYRWSWFEGDRLSLEDWYRKRIFEA